MKILIERWQMCGGGLSYEISVPVSEITPERTRNATCVIVKDIKGKRKEFVSFVDATIPDTHFEMPLGWDRYEHRQNWEKKCHAEMLKILQENFPETNLLTCYPTLWTNGLLAPEPSEPVYIWKTI
jgi:hypothetical protein